MSNISRRSEDACLFVLSLHMTAVCVDKTITQAEGHFLAWRADRSGLFHYERLEFKALIRI